VIEYVPGLAYNQALEPIKGVNAMPTTGPRYSKEEFARRGDAIYDRAVRPTLKDRDNGKFVAIDIETGEFEIDPEEIAACDRLEARVEDPQIWLTRVGLGYARRFGPRPRVQKK
jgi:hypothetical protein